LGSGLILDNSEQQFTFSNSSTPAEEAERAKIKSDTTNKTDGALKDDMLRKYMQENEG